MLLSEHLLLDYCLQNPVLWIQCINRIRIQKDKNMIQIRIYTYLLFPQPNPTVLILILKLILREIRENIRFILFPLLYIHITIKKLKFVRVERDVGT